MVLSPQKFISRVSGGSSNGALKHRKMAVVMEKVFEGEDSQAWLETFGTFFIL